MFAVLADHSLKIKIGQYIAVEYYSWLPNEIFGEFVGARGSHWLRLDGVLQLHAIIGTVAEQLFDLVWLIRKRERDVGNAGASQCVDLIKQKRAIADGYNRLRCVNGERTQPCAFSPSQNQCLHD